MSLAIGSRIGPYDIVAPLGAGGMGEVYRARDPRLGRDVAIKILSAEYTTDAGRLARFEREARVLAALNHPHIATLYGVEQSGDLRALVMELVEGEPLSARIARGPLSVDEVLSIARQIADGLDAAHQKGIIHRDLKPANVQLTPAGGVKLLDFGIAKAAPDHGFDHGTTVMATQEGVTVGTAPYMSPEQLTGQAIDRRTDIWSFGCVLFELLTGRPPFLGETRTDTVARIVGGEPDWQALPRSTPPGVLRLLTRCLQKDPKRRLRDLGDIELVLDTPAATVSGTASSRLAIAASITGLIGLAAGAAAMWLLADRPAPAPTVRFEMPPSIRLAESQSFAVSPDGRRLVFTGTGGDGVLRIWSRTLDNIETRPLIGTENEVAPNSTLWFSPDGRSIGFYAGGAIKVVDSAGGVLRRYVRRQQHSMRGR